MTETLRNEYDEPIGITYLSAKLTRIYTRKVATCMICKEEIKKCYRAWRPIKESQAVQRNRRICDTCGAKIAEEAR